MAGGGVNEGSEVKGEGSSPASTPSVASFYAHDSVGVRGREREIEREREREREEGREHASKRGQNLMYMYCTYIYVCILCVVT